MKTIELGVNIDHVATLRQARGTVYPDLLEAVRLVGPKTPATKRGFSGVLAFQTSAT